MIPPAKLAVVTPPEQKADAHNALLYWKNEAQRRKTKIRELESQNGRLQSFVRPLLMAHLKLRAETRRQLERLGLPDADTILQLAATKSDDDFGVWFKELVESLDPRA